MAYRRSALMQDRLADNRRRILLAARRLVAAGGFRRASMTAIAAESGLSIGALYRYFPSQAALLVEVLSEAVAYEIGILQAITRRPGPARVRLAAAVRSFAERALLGPHLAYAFIVEPTDPEVEAARIVGRHQFGELFSKLLEEGVASAEFPTQPVGITAACIVGAFTEALVRPVGAEGPEVEPGALVEAIVAFCVRGPGGGSG